MPFLSFRLKVAPLQNDKAQLEGDPFCVSLYQAVSRILAGDADVPVSHKNACDGRSD